MIMKQNYKLISFVLVIAMFFSLTDSFTARAESSVTITLRIEQDETMMASPVQITLTDTDTQTDYGLGLATGPVAETATPLHALAKYMKSRGADDTTMNQYIAADFTYGSAYITGISIQGKCLAEPYGSAASGSQDNVYWGFTVNDAAPIDPVGHYGYAADQYILKNNDTVVFYGLWNAWPAEDETLYSYFDRASYTTTIGENLSVSLTGSGMAYDEQYNSTIYTKAVTGASVVAAEYTTADSMASMQNAVITTLTDMEGKAVLTFKKAGIYVLSAYRKAADGKHYDISRPYALVTVNNKNQFPVKIEDNTKKDTGNTTHNTTPAAIKKPAQVKKVKAVVKKSKKVKKTVAVSWKKVSKATGYKVYLSKKKSKGYKRKITTKKTKYMIQLKAGTYYVKVRAYIKSGKKITNGSYSKPLKIKVKKS